MTATRVTSAQNRRRAAVPHAARSPGGWLQNRIARGLFGKNVVTVAVWRACDHADWGRQQQPRSEKKKERKKGRGREGKRYFSSQHLRWDAHSSHRQQTALPDPTGSATAGRGRRVTDRGSEWRSLCCSIPGKGDLHR